MDSGKKMAPCSHLTYASGAVFHLLPPPPSGLLVSHTLAPSHAPSRLCSLSHLCSCFSTLIRCDSLREFGILHTPFTRSPPPSAVFNPYKIPAPSRPRRAPSPTVCLKVWVTLGPRRVIHSVSSCCCPGAPQPAFSPDLSSGLVTRGPPLAPPLSTCGPQPRILPSCSDEWRCCPAQTNLFLKHSTGSNHSDGF